MGIYTSFWQKTLKQVIDKIKPTEFLETEIPVPELIELGDRSSRGYNGRLFTWTGSVETRTDTAVFRHLEEIIEENNQFKHKIPGYLELRVYSNNILKIRYQPITYEMLIERYKNISDERKEKEIYKWKVVKQFQDTWARYEQKKISFNEFYDEIKFGNLVYPTTITVFDQVMKENPQQFEKLLLALYDETKVLKPRIENYTQGFADLYYSMATHGKNTFQEERTIATLLTFRYPEKYTFFKDSFYSKLSRGLGTKPYSKGEKIFHYYSLINDLVSQHLKGPVGVVVEKNKRLDETCYRDQKNLILAQDILYLTLDAKETESVEADEFKETLSLFNEEDTNTYLVTLRKIIRHFNISQEDKRVVFSIRKDRLNFITGQRYAFNIISFNGRTGFGFISTKELPCTTSKFTGGLPAFYNDVGKVNDILEYEADFYTAIETELERTTVSGNSDFDNPAFRQWVFDEDQLKTHEMSTQQPLNQILYGPPGTGKTYNTVNKAVSIANPQFDIANAKREGLKTEYERLVADGQIEFVTFHQSMSYEDFIEGIKPIEPSKEGDPIVYRVVPGIFRQMCERINNMEKLTISNLPSSKSVSSFDQLYSAFISRLKEILSELENNETHSFESRKSKVKLIGVDGDNILTIGEKANSKETITREKLERIYRKFNSADEITSIVKQLREVGTDIGWTTNYFAVFKALKNFESSIKSTTSTENTKIKSYQNFVLIIDEINRGNVSQIFGELITLIEEDKRFGKLESLEIKLPYSKEKFSIPSNLYIIGTMNTADRSVEALDTALRRRFSFEAILPDLSMVTESPEGIILSKMLSAINSRLEALLTKDHTIGHAWLMQIDTIEKLNLAFKNKIMPLLEEFFYNDYAKIGLVLGKRFVEVQKVSTKLFADFDDGNELAAEYTDKIIYKLKNPFNLTAEDYKSIYE